MNRVRPGRTGYIAGEVRALVSSRGAAPAACASGAAAAPASLDQDNNNSTESMPMTCLVVVGCGCRSWWCDRCGKRLGRVLRQRLLSEVERWENCIPITLTLGRWVGGGDPESAWELITKREKIRKLMDALGSKRWVWFLEPQEDGYPHWHVLAEVPGASSREGLASVRGKVWSLWGPKFNRQTGEAAKRPGRWDLGIVNVDKNKLTEQGPRAVVAYCTSYVTKAGDVAAWMLDDNSERRVRKFGASRAVGALRAFAEGAEVAEARAEQSESDEVTEVDENGKSKPQRWRCLRERLAWCGHRSQLFEQWVDRSTGEVRRRYLGELQMAAENIPLLRRDLEQAGLECRPWLRTSEDGERTWIAGHWLRWVEPPSSCAGDWGKAAADAVNDAAERSRWGELTKAEVAERRRRILGAGKGFVPKGT